MNERRGTQIGRRSDDLGERPHCLSHSGLKTSVENVILTASQHTVKLDKVYARVNTTLVSILLTLLVIAVDVIVRLTTPL